MISADTAPASAPVRASNSYLVRAATPQERLWLGERLGYHFSPDARGILAEDSHGGIAAMVCFDRWAENSAEAHVYVGRPIAIRRLAPAAFRWFFNTLGKGVLVGVVRASNEKALELDLRLGFRETHRIKDGVAVGEDRVLLEMRRADCMWLKKEAGNGQRS